MYTVGRNGNLCSHCRKQCGGFSKTKNSENYHWLNNPTFGFIFEKNKNTNLKGYMHPNVHSHNIYNWQDTKLPYVSMKRWMDKKDVVCIYIEILLNHKKTNFLFAAMWMKLEESMLSEIRQKRQILYHLYLESKKM